MQFVFDISKILLKNLTNNVQYEIALIFFNREKEKENN